MDGFGSFYLAFRHQDVFGAAASMSDGVDPSVSFKLEFSKWLGDYEDHPENWEKNTDVNLVYLLTPHSLGNNFRQPHQRFFSRCQQSPA